MAKPADRRAHRATPLPRDRFFWGAATRHSNAAGVVPGSYPLIAWVNRNLGEQMRAQCSRNRPTADPFERAAVSQIRVATKTIVPIVKFQDFLCNGGVYEEAGWIAST